MVKTIKKKKHANGGSVRLLRIGSLVCFLISIVFTILIVLSKNEQVQLWYKTYQDYLISAEISVKNLDDKFSVFLIIMFLYAFKAVFPIYLYPLPLLCAVTSAVFPAYLSIPINILGLVCLYSIKYFWGRKTGSAGVQSLLNKNNTIHSLVEKDGRGNPWLLVLFRIIPGMPINLVSKLYGAMGFRYRKFILLSVLGYMPLLVSYTFIGYNLFNPLSVPFLLPFVIVSLFGTVSMLSVSIVLKAQNKRRTSNA